MRKKHKRRGLMPRRGWGAFESSDGWIKILRWNLPPAEQWPRVQKQTTVVSPELKGRWRNGAPNTPKTPSKLQSFEAALSSLGPEDSGARVELEAAWTRVRAQLKPKPRVSTSPDVAIEEAKLKVTRLEKALEAMGILQEPRSIVCRGHSQRPERQHGNAPWRFKSKNAENFKQGEHRVAKLEADVVAEKTMLEERRARLSRLEQQSQAPPPVVPPSRVAELAMLSEPLPPQRRREVRPVEEDVMPEDAQGLSEWLID